MSSVSNVTQGAFGVHPDDLDHYLQMNRRLNENLEIIDHEYRIINKQGEVRYVRDISEPELDANGVHVKSIGSIQDVTRQKMAEVNLLKAFEKAEHASKAKSSFLANMSHELRTPLNSIIGYSEMMTNKVFGALGDAKYNEYANDIQHSGRHLLEVISDILDISKIEAGEYEIEETDINI